MLLVSRFRPAFSCIFLLRAQKAEFQRNRPAKEGIFRKPAQIEVAPFASATLPSRN